MTEQEILKDICEKENKSGLYDINIGGLPLYSMVRGYVRNRILEINGISVMQLKSPVKRLAVLKSSFVSFGHLLKLFVSRKKYSSIYYAFARVDKVGDYFLDKFTDPIIEQCEKEGNYIILDYGRAGVHPKPRVHADSMVYLDMISVSARLYGILFSKCYYLSYKKEFDSFFEKLDILFGHTFNKSYIIREYVSNRVYIKQLQKLFKRVSAKRVVGPARAFMAAPFIAAKRQGMQTFELQHGVSYGETVLYSGYRDEMILPGFFLAFGENKPLDVYGIDEARIVNVGWAFNDYVAKAIGKNTVRKEDVLVVSDPEITDAIICAVLQLANAFPENTFYIRPHPHELITDQHRKIIAKEPNVKIQDKTINITVTLHSFDHIIGENSTVLYEALAINKKVGKLFFEGLDPKYLVEGDRECFWEIRNQKDFGSFLNGKIEQKRSKCIYSPFDKKKYLTITGIAE